MLDGLAMFLSLSTMYSDKGRKARKGEWFQKCLPIVLLCCIALNVLSEEFPLSCGEREETILIEGVSYLECYCYGPGNNRTTFEWTIVQDTGQLETLATCYGQNNCTNYDPSDVSVSLFESSSFMLIKTLTSRFSGVVMCTQVNDTFRGSANYTVKLKRVSIEYCLQKIDLLEGDNYGAITCTHSPYTPSMVTWTIATHSGQPQSVGQCSMSKNFKSNCTSLLSQNITLTADNTFSSISLGKAPDLRDMATVVCSVRFPNFTDADNCALDVYHPSTVENCSLEINHRNYSLTFCCDVNRAFDSEGQYQFSVYEEFMLLQNGQLKEAGGNLFDGYRFFHQFLVPYINSTEKKLYYRGRVVYTWPLSPYPGTFKRFSFETFRGGNGEVDFQDGLNISLPARPTHNCSDVMTPCYCSTETLGFPVGRLLWLIGNTTVAVGDYGVKELLLSSDNLTNRQDVTVARCQLDWIQTLTSLEPAIFYMTHMIAFPNSYGDKYKSLAITSWTLLCGMVILDAVVLVILWRLGRLPGRSYDVPITTDSTQTART